MNKLIAKNPVAKHNYNIEETLEAGIVLTGTEIKSIRQGKVNLKESYAGIKNGEVYVWGTNNYGQLCQENINKLAYATKVRGEEGKEYLDGIVDIAASGYTALAVDKNGELYGWGMPGRLNALLGIGTTYYPKKIQQVSNIIKIESGYNIIGTMLQNGETIVWGENHNGENGTGTNNNPTDITNIGNDIIELDTKGYSSYILKEDKTVWSTGYNRYGGKSKNNKSIR